MAKVVIDNEIRITSDVCPQEFFAWAEQNYTVPNPDYAKKLRMGFWLGDTPKTLALYKTDGNTLVLPFGTICDLPKEMLANVENLTNKSESVHLNYGDSYAQLYDYQKEAVQALKIANYGILSAPAGSGKTQMGIALAQIYGLRCLWLTHTKDLLNQSKQRAIQLGVPEDMIGTITEGKVNIGSAITFATVQTMTKLDLSEYKHTFGIIIVDECHRVAGSPTTLTMFYKVLNSLSCLHKYGLSATLHRSDGLIPAMHALLGDCVWSVGQDAVAELVMPVEIVPFSLPTQLSEESLNDDGTLNYSRMITSLINNDERNNLIVQLLKTNKGKPSLILSERVAHLEALMALLPEDIRRNSVLIHGKMNTKAGKKQRELALEQMRRGEKLYLFATYSLAKEGLDIPRLSRLYLTTPQKDYAVIAQAVGRVARRAEGKADARVYDLVDSFSYARRAYKKRCTTYNKLNTFVERSIKYERICIRL